MQHKKNSAKTTMDREAVEPILKGSANFGAFWAKCINLSSPCWTSINDPTPTRNMNAEKEKAFSETLVPKNFFIGKFEFAAR